MAELEKQLEEKRVESKLPGLGVAVVKDGKVVFMKGFGYADLEQKVPVDGDTMFAIGSSTKSFTSTLIAPTGRRRQNGLGRPRHQVPSRFQNECGNRR